MGRNILIRCEGGRLLELGTGHVARCLAIAGDLRERGATSVFSMGRQGAASGTLIDRVREAGFQVVETSEAEDEVQSLVDCALETASQVVLLDNLGRSSAAIAQLQAAGLVVISIDDPDNPRRSDLSISPAFWGCGASAEGFDFTILTALSGASSKLKLPYGERSGVVASFGGYDPGGFAETFIDAWQALGSRESAQLAVASSHSDLDGLKRLAAQQEGLTILVDAPLLELLPGAKLAVTNGGTTMLMSASLGAPTLAVAQYDHQRDNAERLANLGGAHYLGDAQAVSASSMAMAMGGLLVDEERRKRLSIGGRQALPGQGRQAVVQRVQLLERLSWDSHFFGFGVATLHGGLLTPRILDLALRECVEQQIACLYFLSQSDDQETLALAEGNGFRWVDERLTFVLTEGHQAAQPPSTSVLLRIATTSDSPQLGETAGNTYEFSRYFFDGNFPRDLCHKFYRDWIQKSVVGEFDDVVFVAEIEGKVAGYISCREASSNLGQIGLVGIAEDYRGRGLGSLLVKRALAWFQERDLPRVEVVTQGRNLPAQRLYRAAGFVLEKSERWYHRWFPDNQPKQPS